MIVLAKMVTVDEDALICDFAETYHIYDFRSLPCTLAAVLACGLRENSRIKLKLSGQRVSTDTLINAVAADALNLLVWSKTEDAKRKRNRPKSIVQILTEEPGEIMTFDSAAEFERRRAEIINGNRIR